MSPTRIETMTVETVSILFLYVSSVPTTEPGTQEVLTKLTISFKKNLRSIYSVLGTILDARTTVVAKIPIRFHGGRLTIRE